MDISNDPVSEDEESDEEMDIDAVDEKEMGDEYSHNENHSFLMSIAESFVEKIYFLKTRSGRAGLVHNFLRGLQMMSAPVPSAGESLWHSIFVTYFITHNIIIRSYSNDSDFRSLLKGRIKSQQNNKNRFKSPSKQITKFLFFRTRGVFLGSQQVVLFYECNHVLNILQCAVRLFWFRGKIKKLFKILIMPVTCFIHRSRTGHWHRLPISSEG